ncbi:peptidase dimerization domain-containing protein, partial [Sandarakinorhabdus sp.]|uniref:peptidase dimerization domain-containing protein n=1 Tax=Sandarakinorhabdus sp. TaxID=1916663 RepID=UPI00286E4F61
RNPGGHSSRPRPDNAIYELAAGLVNLAKTDFPVILSDTTRAYFAEMAKISDAQTAAAIRALLANPADAEANAMVSKDPGWHSTLRTTCVATMLDAGHARNALPQRAQANVNCRMFPGESVEKVRGQIAQRLGDSTISVTPRASENPEQAAPPPPLSLQVHGPAAALAAKHFPGVPLIPTMATGATDGRYLNAAGIATYGMPGRFGMPDGNGVHGLNERISVEGVMKERDYLFDLIAIYANAKDSK